MYRGIAQVLLACLLAASATSAKAQNPIGASAEQDHCTDLDGNEVRCPSDHSASAALDEPSHASGLNPVRQLAGDQAAFWSAPVKLREKHLRWLLPLTAGTAVLIASDTALEQHLPGSPSVIQHSRNFSNFGVAALAATGAGLYFSSYIDGNQPRRQTGWLTAEAVGNSVLVSEVIKYAAGRQRPLEEAGQGRFFHGGNSFPSTHSAVAWSAATVLAGRSSSGTAKLLAYGTAVGVSATRLTSREHFASDVFVGSLLGWYMGRQILSTRGDEADSRRYGTFVRGQEESVRQPDDMGSPYVPIDSWVYASFDRLQAWGYAPSGFLGLRPWTRMECARVLEETSMLLSDDDGSPAAQSYVALKQEFAPEIALLEGGRNRSAHLESIYARVTGIYGSPLRRGYYFGQSIINDYGRPYAEGLNAVTGVSSTATLGPLAFYVRGEYQHAPAAPGLPETARTAIASDYWHELPPPATGDPQIDRVRLLDAYVALQHAGWQLSFGQQTLWWGPGASGPLLLSNNAEPLPMLRLNRASPAKLPSLLSWLGPMRTEYFIGRLRGQHFVLAGQNRTGSWERSLGDQPFVHGMKVSFKPTPNLEFGVSRTTVFGGPGHPVTLQGFAKSLFSASTATGNNDPGDRRSSFDISYRVPKFRKWLLIYNDALADDEISPIAYPRRSAFSPGLYMPQIPKLAKLDFRAEAACTDIPGMQREGFFYYNTRFVDGYTSAGNLLGNWVGRQGLGVLLRSTYWLSPQNTITLQYRQQTVSQQFLEGGNLHDISGQAKLWLRPSLMLTGTVAYQRWDFPALAPTARSPLISSFQLTYWPGR